MRFLSPHEIEYLRREAKKLARTEGMTHAKALDQKANAAGFNSWALLKKSHSDVTTYSTQKVNPTFIRTSEEMKQKFRKFADPITDIIDDQIRNGLSDLSSQYSHPISALKYAESYLEAALALQRYSPSRFSIGYVEMRIYLPYTLHPIQGESDVFILLGRDYKPLGMPQKRDYVEYEKYKNLHVRIPKNELEIATQHSEYSPRYLYGVAPQTDRKHAEAYLIQLKAVIELVEKHA